MSETEANGKVLDPIRPTFQFNRTAKVTVGRRIVQLPKESKISAQILASGRSSLSMVGMSSETVG
jgi:hypothetical protein